MNQPKTKKKTPISGATASATCSARGSVYDFGTISPITTCRIEMKNERERDRDDGRRAQIETLPKTLSSTLRDRRLAERAERDRRERDAELEGRDEARRVRDDLAHRARAAVALGSELVEARVAHRDERVLRRDEERVPEHAEGDQDELDRRQDRSSAHLSGTPSRLEARRPEGDVHHLPARVRSDVDAPLPAPART